MSKSASAGDGTPFNPPDLEHFILGQLLRTDPMNCNYGGAAEDYAPDAQAIAVRLPECHSEAEVCGVVYAQLRASFGEAVGSRENYLPVAQAIWSFVMALEASQLPRLAGTAPGAGTESRQPGS